MRSRTAIDRRIYDAIKDWKWVQPMMPALADAVTGMAHSEKQWIAVIPKYCEKLLDDGQIFFNMDKAGRILPELKGENGRFVKKVRLRETVSMPELLPNLQHLETQAALAIIMNQLENVQEQIAQIRGELQQDRLAKADAAWDQLNQALKITDGRRRENQLENVQEQIAQIRGELQQDRLAKADAAWDQLNQALKITDGRRREQAVIIAIGTGTEAKHTLMRHFASCLHLIEGNADQNEWQLIFGGLFKGKDKKERGEIEARMAYDDLAGILNCVRVETTGHMTIGDTDAARRSLKEFAEFIETEQLDNRDTLLKIDSRLPSAQKRPEIVDEFDAIAQRTMHLSALTAGESVPKQLLEAYRPLQDDEDKEEDAIEETDTATQDKTTPTIKTTDKAAEPSVAVTVASETTDVESYKKEKA